MNHQYPTRYRLKTRQENKDTTSFMPDEILVYIFEYLQVKDIGSCRLVCRRWYSLCDAWSIRKNEKYVFRSGVLTTIEINDILVKHMGTKLSVQFIGCKLHRLRFKKFGKKIRALEITNSSCECDSLKNIFLATPNMKCFIYWYPNDIEEETFIRDLTIDLHKNNSIIHNLEKLECFCLDYEGYATVDLFSEPFANVFPRLTSIGLPQALMDIHESLKCLLIQNNVTELRSVWFPPLGYCDKDKNVDLCLQYDTMKLLPRFTKLEITIDHTLDLVFEFFSQQSWLETLIIRDCVQSQDCSKTKSKKQLLLHVLENCKRLKTLHFYLECTNDKYLLQLNRTDMQQFKKAIAASNPKIDLVMPAITIDGGTSAEFFALFKEVKYLDMTMYPDYDFENRTRNLSLFTLCEDLMQIINSQKCLKRLIVNDYCEPFDSDIEEVDDDVGEIIDDVGDIDDDVEEIDDDTGEIVQTLNNILNVKHLGSDRLEHLELNFRRWTCTIFQTLISWKFPNLITLKLEGLRLFEQDDEDSVTSGELDFIHFANWIKSMPLLKKIHLRWFDLNDDQCLSICRKLPNLETILYKALDVPSKSKLKMIFAHCPTLKKVKVDRLGGTREWYYVNRSKNAIYFCECRWGVYKPYTSMV